MTGVQTCALPICLAQVAGSLTFTTLLSIVPLLVISFALFTRLPVFSRMQNAIEEYLLKGLLPADISRTVLKHLNSFATNASGLTWIGCSRPASATRW